MFVFQQKHSVLALELLFLRAAVKHPAGPELFQFSPSRKKKKQGHLEIVEQRSQLVAMSNICLKLCSRALKKEKGKRLRIAFSMKYAPELSSSFDWSGVSQTIYELKSDKGASKPEDTGGILNFRSSPSFQEGNMSEGLMCSP